MINSSIAACVVLCVLLCEFDSLSFTFSMPISISLRCFSLSPQPPLRVLHYSTDRCVYTIWWIGFWVNETHGGSRRNEKLPYLTLAAGGYCCYCCCRLCNVLGISGSVLCMLFG